MLKSLLGGALIGAAATIYRVGNGRARRAARRAAGGRAVRRPLTAASRQGARAADPADGAWAC